ncbi:MAG: hypothetical protein ACXVEC_12940 [Nocardioides sp.]
MNLVKPIVSPLLRWPVESQQVARRNAMIASTALAQRRAEREEVEEFLAGLLVSPGTDLGSSSTAEVAAQAAVR